MGIASADEKGFIGEGPQHRVPRQGVSVAKFDVTRGEWKAFVDATSRPTSIG